MEHMGGDRTESLQQHQFYYSKIIKDPKAAYARAL